MKFHINHRGEGRPLVLLHAYPLSSAMWSDLKPLEGWEFLLPDFPGFGSSPLPHGEITLSNIAQNLVEEIEKMTGPRPFVLGGISMGGYLALEILRQFSQKVQGVMLISTRAGLDSSEARQKRLDTAERALREGISWLPDAMTPGLLGATTRALNPGLSEKVRSWVGQADAAAVASAQKAMADRRDQRDLCPRILQRTLVLAGREDSLIPISESDAMAAAIPRAKEVILQKVGHLPPLEDPENFRIELEKFLLTVS